MAVDGRTPRRLLTGPATRALRSTTPDGQTWSPRPRSTPTATSAGAGDAGGPYASATADHPPRRSTRPALASSPIRCGRLRPTPATSSPPTTTAPTSSRSRSTRRRRRALAGVLARRHPGRLRRRPASLMRRGRRRARPAAATDGPSAGRPPTRTGPSAHVDHAPPETKITKRPTRAQPRRTVALSRSARASPAPRSSASSTAGASRLRVAAPLRR